MLIYDPYNTNIKMIHQKYIKNLTVPIVTHLSTYKLLSEIQLLDLKG